MIDNDYIIAVEQRVAHSVGTSWSFAYGAGGEPVISVEFPDGHQETMRVTREGDSASEVDVRFIASSKADTEKLLKAWRRSAALTLHDLSEIEDRCARATSGPWAAFIEADGGLAGCDVIRVTERDGEPDLYLWVGSELAPSATFRFVRAARQDIPRLLAALRH